MRRVIVGWQQHPTTQPFGQKHQSGRHAECQARRHGAAWRGTARTSCMLAEATNPTDWLHAIMAAVSGCSLPLGCMVGEEKRSGKSRFKSLPALQGRSEAGGVYCKRGGATQGQRATARCMMGPISCWVASSWLAVAGAGAAAREAERGYCRPSYSRRRQGAAAGPAQPLPAPVAARLALESVGVHGGDQPQVHALHNALGPRVGPAGRAGGRSSSSAHWTHERGCALLLAIGAAGAAAWQQQNQEQQQQQQQRQRRQHDHPPLMPAPQPHLWLAHSHSARASVRTRPVGSSPCTLPTYLQQGKLNAKWVTWGGQQGVQPAPPAGSAAAAEVGPCLKCHQQQQSSSNSSSSSSFEAAAAKRSNIAAARQQQQSPHAVPTHLTAGSASACPGRSLISSAQIGLHASEW